jgi:hypothetical protein
MGKRDSACISYPGLPLTTQPSSNNDRLSTNNRNAMTSAPDRRALAAAQIHKKKYFGASPTWHVWNKLTARHVFALTQMPHFEGIALPSLHPFFSSFASLLSHLSCKQASC